MSCTNDPGCTCGCCAGTGIATPQARANLPGQSAVAYRSGTWATFRESMLARLSSTDYPALARLSTRDTDDFSIALLDASAVVFDILTFYQERLANESYLRTATQLRSLIEATRLIGYQPAPGVAALTGLAFTIKAAPGLAADPGTRAITIPAGTQVQSVPGQNQVPQSFETSSDILAKADWNALPVVASRPWSPPGTNTLQFAGTATQLNPGDSLLILGAAREHASAGSALDAHWDVVTLNQVVVDQQNNRTRVGWARRLAHVSGAPTASGWTTAKVFAFRQKAALFGHNAPSPELFTSAKNKAQTSLPLLIDTTSTPWTWKGYDAGSSTAIDLDASYPKVVEGSWFALVADGNAQLYQAVSARTISRSDFVVSARITSLAADWSDTAIGTEFPRPDTAVLAQSELLQVAPQPLDNALYGSIVEIQALRPDLVGIQAVALTGKAQKLAVGFTASPLHFVPDDGSADLVLRPGDVITLIDPRPLKLDKDGGVPPWRESKDKPALRVTDASGRTGTVTASLAHFTLAPSDKDDPDVQEFARVRSVLATNDPYPHTRILLSDSLTHCYERTTTTVNANVGLATAGRKVAEVMGSGAAAMPNQRFPLRQSPLTYVQSSTPTGRQSTLVVRANGVAWKEVPTLYGQPGSASVFTTSRQGDGTTTAIFGDRVEGATLPTGRNNLLAVYRVGSGVAGNVAAATITTLIDRPLGVSGVTNPAAATGGQDPQQIADVRANAPLSVLTLGRAVSITDYEDYAASYAGIAKANALWIANGPSRGVFLTVAAAGGAALPPGNQTLGFLLASLQRYGNPLVPIAAVTFVETLFRVAIDVACDPDFDRSAVEAAIVATLRARYLFATRRFGQGVAGDEVASLVQGVPGVLGANVTALTLGPSSTAGDLAGGGWSVYAYTQWLAQKVLLSRPSPGTQMRICPAGRWAVAGTAPQPAEILVLDPDPRAISLGVLS